MASELQWRMVRVVGEAQNALWCAAV